MACSSARRGEIHSLTGASGGTFFFCSVRGGGNSLTHWRVHGCVWFFLLFARRGKFTHSLARPRARFFFLLCARRWTFTHSLARPGVIHSLTGACGGAFFFLLRARRGKFTHSLARPRLCVVGTEGAFFFLLRARRGKFTPSLARLRLCVVEKAGAFFFLLRARQGEIHSLTGASGGAFFFFCARRGKFTHSLACPRLCVFFFCCLRGGGNSLTHSRVRGRFFFFLCARRWTFTHSLARPGVIHSLTGASGGAFFFFLLRARWGKFTHSLARPRLCVVGTEGAFFFCSVRGGPSKKKNTGRVSFFVRHAAGRAKKKLFSRARRAKKKHIFRILPSLSNS